MLKVIFSSSKDSWRFGVKWFKTDQEPHAKFPVHMALPILTRGRPDEMYLTTMMYLPYAYCRSLDFYCLFIFTYLGWSKYISVPRWNTAQSIRLGRWDLWQVFELLTLLLHYCMSPRHKLYINTSNSAGIKERFEILLWIPSEFVVMGDNIRKSKVEETQHAQRLPVQSLVGASSSVHHDAHIAAATQQL